MILMILQDTMFLMEGLRLSFRHMLFIITNFVMSCLILVFSRNLVELNVPLFEEIIYASVLSTMVMLGSTFFLTKWKLLHDSNRILVYINIIALLVSVLILPYALLNVDRSRSFYVLSWVDQNKISKSGDQFLVQVQSSESLDIRGVKQRVEEQQQRGLIRENNGVYQVTEIGSFMLGVANFLAELFNLENWKSNKN